MATQKIKAWISGIFEEKIEAYELLLFQELFNKFRKAIKEKDEQHVQFIRACNKARHQDKTEFIKKMFGEAFPKNIIVGEEINSDNQYLGELFTKDLLNQARKKEIPLNVLDNYSVGEYELEEAMNSVAIQKKTNILPEKENKFWACSAVLTENPKLGKIFFNDYELRKDKVYLMHVRRTSKKLFVVRIAWKKDKWEFLSRDFFYPAVWGNKGDIFLYLTKIAT